MKIEKINDNQIRCTLTREDLISRNLKFSELAYGTEKAKSLFREMMRQANYEVGFEAENIPLMIEAIPLNHDCLVLVITKVEDPEELDTRFARFAPNVTEGVEDDEELESLITSNTAEEARELFNRVMNAGKPVNDKKAKRPAADRISDIAAADTAAFVFPSLDETINVCKLIASGCDCKSKLLKEKNGNYCLLLEFSEGSHSIYNKVCNTVSEYGIVEKNPGQISTEHSEVLIAADALQVLGNM